MKKIFFILLLLQGYLYSEEDSSKNFQMEFGVTAYGYNLAYGGFDFDFNIPFWERGMNRLSVKTSLMTLIPASVFQSDAPYILFGGLFELQYSISTEGFLFALETGIGVASEFYQEEVYEEGKGFVKDSLGTPYAIYSLGLRTGYDFKEKFNQPFKLALFIGYRMQFPYNFTFKYTVLYGGSLSYTFDFGGNK